MALVARSPTRRNIDLQVSLDARRARGRRDRADWQCVLLARMRAVVGAQLALAAREEGAMPALRQSLVDLASVCELLAADIAKLEADDAVDTR